MGFEAQITAIKTAVNALETVTEESICEIFAEKRAAIIEAGGGKYRLRLEDLDKDALSVLRSGILSGDELIALETVFPCFDSWIMKRIGAKVLYNLVFTQGFPAALKPSILEKCKSWADTVNPVDRVLEPLKAVLLDELTGQLPGDYTPDAERIECAYSDAKKAAKAM